MSSLIPSTTRKSADPHTEKVLRARAGMASFSRSFADMAGHTVETGPKAAAFVSALGGASNMPEVERQRSAKKADVLDALPVNARKAAEPFDYGTKAFVAALYARHAQTQDAISFTASEAGVIMGKTTEQARKSVEALASAGIIKPSYRLGVLAGYAPGILN
jgi:hypothetical protein